MTMRRLIRSAQSDVDLIAIWRNIAADNTTAATRLLERIDRRIRSLVDYPFIGEMQMQFGENTRRLIEGNYLNFYDVLPEAVHVLRIYTTRLESWMNCLSRSVHRHLVRTSANPGKILISPANSIQQVIDRFSYGDPNGRDFHQSPGP